MTASLILGMLVGALFGVTGAGGGILAVPVLVAGMGWSMQQAAPVALIAIAGSAAIGALDGFRKKLVRYRAAALMAIMGVPCTLVGSHVAHAISQRWLMGLFGIIMLIVGVRLLLQKRDSVANSIGTTRRTIARINPETGRFQWSWATAFLFTSIGAMAGFLAGLLGVGGGFVIVPMLRRFTNVSMHSVVATSLMTITMVSSGGIMVALARGVVMPVEATLFFALATVTGMATGRQLAFHLSGHQVQRGFAAVLIVVALGLVTRASLSTVFN